MEKELIQRQPLSLKACQSVSLEGTGLKMYCNYYSCIMSVKVAGPMYRSITTYTVKVAGPMYRSTTTYTVHVNLHPSHRQEKSFSMAWGMWGATLTRLGQL